MIKVLILNACINMSVDLPVNYQLTIVDANMLQHTADTCAKHYKSCLKTAELKLIKGGKHFNILCGNNPTGEFNNKDFTGVNL